MHLVLLLTLLVEVYNGVTTCAASCVRRLFDILVLAELNGWSNIFDTAVNRSVRHRESAPLVFFVIVHTCSLRHWLGKLQSKS